MCALRTWAVGYPVGSQTFKDILVDLPPLPMYLVFKVSVLDSKNN